MPDDRPIVKCVRCKGSGWQDEAYGNKSQCERCKGTGIDPAQPPRPIVEHNPKVCERTVALGYLFNRPIVERTGQECPDCGFQVEGRGKKWCPRCEEGQLFDIVFEHPAGPITKRVCGYCGGAGIVKVNEHQKTRCPICEGRGFKIVRR